MPSASGAPGEQEVRPLNDLLVTRPEGCYSAAARMVAGDVFAMAIQKINVSTNLGREALFELGRRGPYHRYVSFPVELSVPLEVSASGC